MADNEYFKSRRTIRKYASSDISDEEIKSMAKLAAQAPTTGNMQLYSLIITRDDVQKARLAPAHFSQPAFMSAPVILTFCADFNRFVKWCTASEAEPGYDNFQSFMAAVLDVTIFAQQFCTIAERNGYGCCYLGTTTYNAEEISMVLELPEMVVPIVTLSLGRPAEDGVVSDRLPIEAIVHVEKYRDDSPRRVKSFFAEKEELPESIGFVEENHKKTLAQVFTDIRYPRESNEYFSRTFVDFIKKAGFRF